MGILSGSSKSAGVGPFVVPFTFRGHQESSPVKGCAAGGCSCSGDQQEKGCGSSGSLVF